MHNAAFNACGLPHAYSVLELPEALADPTSPAADAFRAFVRAPNFGGLSVTIPHKEVLRPYLDELTPAAAAIGAVNTVTPTPAVVAPDGVATLAKSPPVLTGDNTDWIGIVRCVEAALRRGGRSLEAKHLKAVVVGSGGTARAACYALTAGWAERHGEGFELLARGPRGISERDHLCSALAR